MELKRCLNAVMVVAFVFAGVFQAQESFGFAYRLPTQSTKGLAKGNAVATDLNDPAAVYYNPAATAHSSGTQVTVGSNFVTTKTDRDNDALGIDESSKRKSFYLPHAFATVNLEEKGLAPIVLGAGVSSPAGLGMVYDEESTISPIVQKAKLKVANYSITGAYKLDDQWSIGSGIDIAYSEGELQNQVDYGSLAGLPRALDGTAEFKGDGTSVGFNVSALYLPAENHSLAFTMRSQQVVELDGDIKARGIPAFVGLPASLDGDGEVRLKYPMVLQGAYGYQMNKWKFEFMLDWAKWDSVNTLKIKSTSNPLIADTIYAGDFENVFTYNASATYALNEVTDVYLGFIWTESPIPDNTFNALVPDSDRFALSCGVGYDVNESLRLDAAFQWAHLEGRNIDNNVGLLQGANVDGNYSTDAFLVGLDVTYQF